MKFKKRRNVDELLHLEYYDTNENCPCNNATQCACGESKPAVNNNGGGTPGCVVYPEIDATL